jgi:hypothetical protein
VYSLGQVSVFFFAILNMHSTLWLLKPVWV